MAKSIAAAQVKSIIFACEAGMGSSLMSVNSLKKKLKAANITSVAVTHMPAREIPANAELVVVHKGLAKVARAKAPDAVVLAFSQFLNDPVIDGSGTTLRLVPRTSSSNKSLIGTACANVSVNVRLSRSAASDRSSSCVSGSVGN